MKVIKVVYNNQTSDILNILKDERIKNVIIETYNIDFFKDKKKAIPIMTRFGTKEVPLIVFADENLIEYSAIWKESKSSITADLILQHINETGI